MNKHLRLVALTALLAVSFCGVNAQRGNYDVPDEDVYGYLYCHMSDHGQWTAYALSQDGLHFHDLLCGDSIFSAAEMARIEGVSAFRVTGEDGWRIGYIEYSSRPHNYRICKADRFMRNFSQPQNIEGVDGPQYGSFLRLTRSEYERLQQWSDRLEPQHIKPSL